MAQPGVTLPAQADAAAANTNPPAQQPAQPQPSQPVAQANPAPSTGAGGLPAGVDEESVSTIVAITNKPREQCIQALQLARGNADLACSLLMEGVDLNQVAGAMGPGGGPGAGAGQDDYADYGDEDMAGMGGAGQPGAGMAGMAGMMGGMGGAGGAGMN